MPMLFLSLLQLIWEILNRPGLDYLLKYLLLLAVLVVVGNGFDLGAVLTCLVIVVIVFFCWII
jgi:hypothetical protein